MALIPVPQKPAPPAVVESKISAVKLGEGLEVVEIFPGKVIATDGKNHVKVIVPGTTVLKVGDKVNAKLIRNNRDEVIKGYLISK